jgi:monoamine oxidase
VSLLHFLFLIRSHGGIEKLSGVEGGDQQNRVVGGTQVLTDWLAEQLGDRIVLNAPVRAIDQSGGGVRVVSEAGTVQADHAIVAIPPTLAGRIDYDPPMPANRDGLTSRAPMGYAIKTFAVYPTPFWRDAGQSGVSFTNEGPCKFGFDNSPPGGKPGVLLGFIEADDGRYWGARSAAARRSAVLRQMAQLYGPQAARPTKYIEKNWAAEAYTRGCSTWFLPPGMWTEYGRLLHQPVGRIHWAGTETALERTGSMDGAIGSGDRAANEVLGA